MFEEKKVFKRMITDGRSLSVSLIDHFLEGFWSSFEKGFQNLNKERFTNMFLSPGDALHSK